MYYPEIDSDIRLNEPKAHQRIIRKWTASLGNLFYLDYKILLEPLPETQIDEGKASSVPCILL